MLRLPFSLVCLISSVFLSPVAASSQLKMSTTTSIENSGLLDLLVPAFERKSGFRVKVIAVGTGAALRLAERGDVDLVFVHDREAEDKFISSGFGINRREVMYNDFVILGPPEDPAGIKGAEGAVDAVAKIARSRSPFVSRGDGSGTHAREKAIWQRSGIKPEGRWYLESGQGMGATIIIADQKSAYTLSDRATFLAFKDKVGLVVLLAGDPILKNIYSVIATNPARFKHVNHEGAMAFINWVTSSEGQSIIKGYKLSGSPLFYPMAAP